MDKCKSFLYFSVYFTIEYLIHVQTALILLLIYDYAFIQFYINKNIPSGTMLDNNLNKKKKKILIVFFLFIY